MKIHIVQKGDTLWEIANQYEADFEKVKQLNPQLSSPDMIMPGMKIKIPATSKPVKKEEKAKSTTQKEKQMPAAEKPYKDTSPPPMPVVKEDDVKKPKDVKPQVPMQPKMPSMDGMPTPPQMPDYTKLQDKLHKEPKMKYYKKHPSPEAQNYHHAAPPKQHMPYMGPAKGDCGCGGSHPMPMPMYQPMMSQMPYHQPPMPYKHHHTMPMHSSPGGMMKSPLEMPAKPMLSQCYSPEPFNSANMQHGFHYSDMPQSPYPQFTDQKMPKPPGYHKNFRTEEDDESTGE
ncbi:morphogenetic protein associated with SpoVID [Lentibacillus persicus]|uniref:Morphogenetic protein associated with SpoVID n=1 Tax=Lentibacillus persicus TaxID=640948 RepID=A0A1I1TGW5_9BACI|nr:SafA/ExsA family spore coat assembly protein [Lentibacillus persicus]SFD57836.1 morphogenetic protein associated with SpoVID [Lentibacillus persicus]